MSLYAIGDLHLHFQSELKAKNQIEDKIWQNHEAIFKENCNNVMTDDDTLVLVGDHSWGKNLAECEKDLEYICDLPGRKILLRGNHDMFWDAKKTDKLNEMFAGKLEFLQNNYFVYADYALVGTKGYTFEGPFYLDQYGYIQGWDEAEAEHAEKMVKRESERLIASFEAAKADGYKKFIMFLHYPPTNILQTNSIYTKIAEQYKVEQVIYGHCHGESRFHDSIIGKKRRIKYSLVSGDFLRWKPMQILK
ncbi:Predicted phosphohydrolase [Butyrivibrio fibrisolvens 16/4]|nr:Predicted phosphohydrolase [Butyrivibrio fibrisolvens 16/4]